MTPRQRITTAAGATTGEVLPADGIVNQWTGNLPDHSQPARAASNGISERTQRKLDALARRAPELLDQVFAELSAATDLR